MSIKFRLECQQLLILRLVRGLIPLRILNSNRNPCSFVIHSCLYSEDIKLFLLMVANQSLRCAFRSLASVYHICLYFDLRS